jgi:hypothetical protein
MQALSGRALGLEFNPHYSKKEKEIEKMKGLKEENTFSGR